MGRETEDPGVTLEESEVTLVADSHGLLVTTSSGVEVTVQMARRMLKSTVSVMQDELTRGQDASESRTTEMQGWGFEDVKEAEKCLAALEKQDSDDQWFRSWMALYREYASHIPGGSDLPTPPASEGPMIPIPAARWRDSFNTCAESVEIVTNYVVKDELAAAKESIPLPLTEEDRLLRIQKLQRKGTPPQVTGKSYHGTSRIGGKFNDTLRKVKHCGLTNSHTAATKVSDLVYFHMGMRRVSQTR